MQPFSRCLQCNGELRPAAVEEIADRVPPGVVRDFDAFSVCGDCGRVYWAGSHYDRLRGIVDLLLQSITSDK